MASGVRPRSSPFSWCCFRVSTSRHQGREGGGTPCSHHVSASWPVAFAFFPPSELSLHYLTLISRLYSIDGLVSLGESLKSSVTPPKPLLDAILRLTPPQMQDMRADKHVEGTSSPCRVVDNDNASYRRAGCCVQKSVRHLSRKRDCQRYASSTIAQSQHGCFACGEFTRAIYTKYPFCINRQSGCWVLKDISVDVGETPQSLRI